MTPPIPPEASKEIEQVRSLVARHFPVYDVRVAYDVVEFFVKTDPTTLEDNFEQLRSDMAQQGYIPMITYDKGEHVITVAKKPLMRFRSLWVNFAMLIVTFVAMVVAGAINWAGYAGVPSNELFAPNTVLTGILVFTLPLMAIIGVHELSHYLMARRRHVAASLPFFLPSIPPLGTFGAFISLREPIPNKKVLLEIGVAGPLAGLALAIPIGILGLILTNDGAKLANPNVGSGGTIGVMFPLIYSGIAQFVPIAGPYLLHPMAFAAWVGFLVTALNLLPMGQLDGGHVARALLGAKAKYLTYATVAVMVGLGFFYLSWFLFAALVLFLGLRHPPPLNDITKLDVKRKAVGIAAFVVLVISFVPIPLATVAPDYSFAVTSEARNATVAPAEAHVFEAVVNNTGNAYNVVEFTPDAVPLGWSLAFKQRVQGDASYASKCDIVLNTSQNRTMDVLILSSANSTFGSSNIVTVKVTSVNDSTKVQLLNYNLTIISPRLEFWIENDNQTAPRGSWVDYAVQVNNTGAGSSNITLDARGQAQNFVDAFIIVGATNSSGPVNLTVPANSNVTFHVNVTVNTFSTAGEKIATLYVDSQGATIARLDLRLNVT